MRESTLCILALLLAKNTQASEASYKPIDTSNKQTPAPELVPDMSNILKQCLGNFNGLKPPANK